MNLTDVDRRLERAKEIRTRLADEVARFLASEPFGTVERYDSGGMFWVDVFARRMPPDEWGIVVSEFAHHVRAALNNTVNEIAVA